MRREMTYFYGAPSTLGRMPTPWVTPCEVDRTCFMVTQVVGRMFRYSDEETKLFPDFTRRHTRDVAIGRQETLCGGEGAFVFQCRRLVHGQVETLVQ